MRTSFIKRIEIPALSGTGWSNTKLAVLQQYALYLLCQFAIVACIIIRHTTP